MRSSKKTPFPWVNMAWAIVMILTVVCVTTLPAALVVSVLVDPTPTPTATPGLRPTARMWTVEIHGGE